MTACACAEQQSLLSVGGTLSHDGPVGHGRDGKWHSRRGHIGAVVAIQFAASVTQSRLVDAEPVVSTSGEPLVPIKAVISYESYRSVVDLYVSTKELDAIVLVSENFDVVDGGSSAHTAECQSVDFIGGTQLGSSVTDAHVR